MSAVHLDGVTLVLPRPAATTVLLAWARLARALARTQPANEG